MSAPSVRVESRQDGNGDHGGRQAETTTSEQGPATESVDDEEAEHDSSKLTEVGSSGKEQRRVVVET